MALPDINEQSEKKNEAHKSMEKKEKLPSKVVIRRLPPTMDSETFLNQISPIPSYDYFYMVKGDSSLGENAFSRAYINFTNLNDIYDFKEKFDNYVFLDSAGHEYPAVVEFAAFQKIPKRRNKVRVDPKAGSIESDQYYLEFVEMINKPPEQDEKPEYSYQITTENKNETITPLLEYIKNKRVEKLRIREERREERKRREFERKKFREDERKKRYEEKSPVKNKSQYPRLSASKEKSTDNKGVEKVGPVTSEDLEKFEKPPTVSHYKKREKSYDEKKKEPKHKYPIKKDYIDKKEHKIKREDLKERDYRSKYDDSNKDDSKVYQKKVKKYSEKREERKIEAQKAEQKKLEQLQENSQKEDHAGESSLAEETKENPKNLVASNNETVPEGSSEKQHKSKESDTQSQRRIRNKDRPTIAIYRPGMLSKRKQADGDNDHTENKKE